jgi:hypothetical protein
MLEIEYYVTTMIHVESDFKSKWGSIARLSITTERLKIASCLASTTG